jgi:hypothetical protein
MLREIAAASEAVVLPPEAIHTAAALEQRGLIKRKWRSNGLPLAVVTADGRYYLKHGEHPREVQAAMKRLDADAGEAARAPADGAWAALTLWQESRLYAQRRHPAAPHQYAPNEQGPTCPRDDLTPHQNERQMSVRISPITPTPHITHTHKTAGQAPFAIGSRIATHST